jgi:hypothetical protein
MSAKKNFGKFTRRCRTLFDAGLALAKASTPKEFAGPWRASLGKLVIEAEEKKCVAETKKKSETPEGSDSSEIALVIKIADKTIFSAQVVVRCKGQGARELVRLSERIEKYVPGKWENVLAAAFRILIKSL